MGYLYVKDSPLENARQTIALERELRQAEEHEGFVKHAVRKVMRRKIKIVKASSLKIKPIEWLWEERVAVGDISLLFGDPELGKSLLTCRIAADVSRHSDVVMASAEDGYEDSMLPRLKAARADIDRIHFVLDDIRLPDDVDGVEEYVRSYGARLLTMDPFMAYLPETINSWSDQSVRRALAPLHRMAASSNCAVLIVAHANKSDQPGIKRVGGSIGIPAAARSALEMTQYGELRQLRHVKSSDSARRRDILYKIEPVLLDGGIETARLENASQAW